MREIVRKSVESTRNTSQRHFQVDNAQLAGGWYTYICRKRQDWENNRGAHGVKIDIRSKEKGKEYPRNKNATSHATLEYCTIRKAGGVVVGCKRGAGARVWVGINLLVQRHVQQGKARPAIDGAGTAKPVVPGDQARSGKGRLETSSRP
jgi:hypothetical protein